jgi:hypothetical protein
MLVRLNDRRDAESFLEATTRIARTTGSLDVFGPSVFIVGIDNITEQQAEQVAVANQVDFKVRNMAAERRP